MGLPEFLYFLDKMPGRSQNPDTSDFQNKCRSHNIALFQLVISPCRGVTAENANQVMTELIEELCMRLPGP
jgi:hypothetical protein